MIVGFCYQDASVVAVAITFSVAWCVLSLFIFKKEEVSRRRIGKLIINFTKLADINQPIRIFGGDLNFFGSYVPPRYKKKALFNSAKNKFIETNDQYLQIKNDGFREVKILAIKPYSDTEKDKLTRIRIGYIASELKERVQIKFFDTRLCENCINHDSCTICDCNNCSQKSKCKNSKKKCSKLEEAVQNSCYNPDVTLRGRIVINKDSKSPCVAIATTKRAGKKYILREYSSLEKECKLYTVIWDVWWSKCKVDSEFIQRCKDEYEQSKQ